MATHSISESSGAPPLVIALSFISRCSRQYHRHQLSLLRLRHGEGTWARFPKKLSALDTFDSRSHQLVALVKDSSLKLVVQKAGPTSAREEPEAKGVHIAYIILHAFNPQAKNIVQQTK